MADLLLDYALIQCIGKNTENTVLPGILTTVSVLNYGNLWRANHLQWIQWSIQKYWIMWQDAGEGVWSACPERLWVLLLWRYSRPAWTRSCAACSRWPCFDRGGWTRWPTEVPSNPYYSVILWFYFLSDTLPVSVSCNIVKICCSFISNLVSKMRNFMVLLPKNTLKSVLLTL